MAFRFIHTADWQIGKPFAAVAGDSGAELRTQRIKTVGRIAELARERAVDAVLVAGDAFDSNEVSDRTIHRAVEALRPFAGTWVFLPGNHDAALPHSVWTRMAAMGPPPNVVVADSPTPIERWDGRASVLPAPLRRRREALDQTEWFDGAATARPNELRGRVAQRDEGRTQAARGGASGTGRRGRKPSRVSDASSGAAQT